MHTCDTGKMHLYLKKCALVALCISGGVQAATATKAQSALGSNPNDSLDQASEIQSWFALASADASDRPGYPEELAAWFRPDGFGNFAFPKGPGEASRGNEVSGFRTPWWPGWVASPVAWADANEGPTSETPSSSGRDGSGDAPQEGASLDPRPASGPRMGEGDPGASRLFVSLDDDLHILDFNRSAARIFERRSRASLQPTPGLAWPEPRIFRKSA